MFKDQTSFQAKVFRRWLNTAERDVEHLLRLNSSTSMDLRNYLFQTFLEECKTKVLPTASKDFFNYCSRGIEYQINMDRRHNKQVCTRSIMIAIDRKNYTISPNHRKRARMMDTKSSDFALRIALSFAEADAFYINNGACSKTMNIYIMQLLFKLPINIQLIVVIQFFVNYYYVFLKLKCNFVLKQICTGDSLSF